MSRAARKMQPETEKSESKRTTGPWLGRSLVQPAVMGLFHRHGVLSGARLSELLGVGRSSAHLILDRLHRDGCLVLEARKSGEKLSPGRPTTDYRLNRKHGVYAGVNLAANGGGLALLAFDGVKLSCAPIELAAGATSGAALVDRVAGLVRAAVLRADNGPLLHLSIAMHADVSAEDPGVVESSALLTESGFALEAELSKALGNVPTRIIGPAQAGATAVSMGDPARPVPALFVIAQPDYDCPAGYAVAGRSVSGARRRAGSLDSIARRRKVWLGRLPAAEGLDWGALSRKATASGGEFKPMHRALVEELAEEIAKLASFLDVAQVSVESPDAQLIESILPEVAELATATIRLSSSHTPAIGRAPAGWDAVALGAAVLPIASAVTRAVDFEHGAHQPEVSGHIPMVLMDTVSS